MKRTEHVSGPALMAHCQKFAQHIKLSGTPEELESLRYIKAQLDSFGYRTDLLHHQAYISLPGPACVEIDGRTVKAITHSFSKPSTGLTGTLVYLGHGTEADFSRDDLKGAIVLVEGIANPGVASRARLAGAAGQLHISPHEHLHEMCISPVWGSPGLEALDQLPQTVTCTISNADGAALRARLAQGETPHVMLHAEVETGWRQTPILTADMPADDTDTFVLFSGHHDTWYYGVMDNGGANATMIEAARVLAQDKANWRRGLRLCFWSGHSHGRYSSSAWYADTNWDELDRHCAAHVNVDSTGGIGADIMDESSTASELAGLAADSVRAITGAEHTGKRCSRSSDMSFWGIGIPAMFGGLSLQPDIPGEHRWALGWWWHTPEDLLDKIDEANLVRDTKVFVHALARLLCDTQLPLDFSHTATSLLGELATLQTSLGGRLSLAPLITATETIAATSGAKSDAALMAASRALVPMDYSNGDRFTHDPALAQSPWPVLDPIRTLAKATAETAPFAAVDALRARNRVHHALREAALALK